MGLRDVRDKEEDSDAVKALKKRQQQVLRTLTTELSERYKIDFVQFAHGSMAADIVRSSRKPFSFIDEELMKKIESHKELQKKKKDSGEGGPIRGREHFYGQHHDPY